ncbi:MAG TPA: lysophospholipid acyltransferase family protein [Longimicrobiales bacterium]|nr:lysophospholipid acyltransferase family protein [Longimicrobiales bacterium]
MTGPKPTAAHRAEYLLFRGLGLAARALGPRGAALLGAGAGRLAYGLGIRRRVVLENLRASFPERDEAWVRMVAAACYAHLGREGMVLARLWAEGPERVLDGVEFEGLEAFRAAVDEGRGVVLVTGHFGNWELAGATIAAVGLPIDVVVQRQANPLFDRALEQARERLGMRPIDRRRAPQLALRSLRAGRIVAFVADQDARGSGVFVPFFGRPASTHRGPALLALRAGSPLFLGYGIRLAPGRFLGHLERVEVDRGGEIDVAVDRLTAAFTAKLEEAIRRAPDQYFWHHRRWKTRPREELRHRRPV